MMVAAYVTDGVRKARIFAAATLPSAAALVDLLARDMDEDDLVRRKLLHEALEKGLVHVVTYPGDQTLPDALFAYLVGEQRQHLFACLLVPEARLETMVEDAGVVVEGFSLQAMQGGRGAAEVEAALADWASRNFPSQSTAVFDVQGWLAAPDVLPASWELDSSVADPPYVEAA